MIIIKTKKIDKPQVGVIVGGRSVEHDISILSGLQVVSAIDKEKYDVTVFYLTKDNKWLIGSELVKLDIYKRSDFSQLQEVLLINKDGKVGYIPLTKPKIFKPIDIFIPVLHGEGTEDGTITGYLEMLNANYTSANQASSGIAQNKYFTKVLIESIGIAAARGHLLKRNDFNIDILDHIINELYFPLIVKPNTLGSSIGVKKCNDKNELNAAVLEAFKYTNEIIIEKYLQNTREFNCAVIKDGNHLIASCIEEVFPKEDILSFIDKYEENLDKLSARTNRTIPAIISETLTKRIKDTTTNCYHLLNMKGVVRVDYLYVEETNELYFNEINTIPGSMAFYLFDKDGISFTDLVEKMIKNALLEKQQKDKLISYFPTNVLNKKGIKLN